MKHRFSFFLWIGLASSAAQAAPTPARQVLRPDLPVAVARELLDATIAACHSRGKTLAVAIVDRGGNLMALQRDDSVGPHNTLAAQRKAYTALSTRMATRQLADNARANPDAANLTTLPELLLLGGGVPLTAGKDVIGAIGVAGAGGAATDEACALDAIERIFPRYPTNQDH